MRPPRAWPTHRPAVAVRCAGLAVTSLLAVSLAAAGPAAGRTVPTAGTTTSLVQMASPGSTMQVYWRGNGHGHGMSQYGARGAAIQGLGKAQILRFYYPGTTLTKLAPSTIRVRISAATRYTTVFAGPLAVSGYAKPLPLSGYSRFRLVPSRSLLQLQGRWTATGKWKTIKDGLRSGASFSSTKRWVRLLLADGTSTRYHGSVGAVRNGTGEFTVNRVSLDYYTQGVAPREMPASWDIAAVRAQAIAARSYAKYSMNAVAGGGSYDICDTTSCQVYGGMAHYDSAGNLLYTDDPAVIAGNENTVLTYRGTTIFAQYAASNGGATVDGGQPYLVGKTDPYDTAASGDPYLGQSAPVKVSTLAARYGLATISSIEISRRDGNGPWGGRVQAAYVNGTNTSGTSVRRPTTGFELGGNAGVYTDYLRFATEPTVPSKPTAVTAAARESGAWLSWGYPASNGKLAITGYRVLFAGHSLSLPATARSAWVGPLSNMRATWVSVRAVNAEGASPGATLAIRPRAAPRRIVAVSPMRLFDTRSLTAVVDKAHPFRFAVLGHGSIPTSGARSVQLAVSIRRASASGVLTVASSGVDEKPLAAVAYRAGHTAVATISVPLWPSSTLVFTPSAGQVELQADQESYTAATGSLITTPSPQRIATVKDVPTGQGVQLSLAGLRGITSSTRGVLLAVSATTSGSPTSLRVWAQGAAPTVRQVAVTPDASGANTLFVAISSTQHVRIAALVRATTARVTLLGVLGTTGGRFETFPASAVRDATSTVALGATPVTVPIVGVSQVPASGVRAVLMQVTVRSNGTPGWLWVYPADATRTGAARAVIFAGTGSATATALVRVGPSGKLKLQSSAPGVHVALDAIGYITTR